MPVIMTPGVCYDPSVYVGVFAMAVVTLKLTEALDAQLTEQAQRRRLSKSELVR